MQREFSGLWPALLFGTAWLVWFLGYPFYGVLAVLLPGGQVPAAGHSFAVAHAAGLLLFGWAGGWAERFRIRDVVASRPAVPVSAVCALIAAAWPAAATLPLGATVACFVAAGVASAVPMLAWAETLGRNHRAVAGFVVAVVSANAVVQLLIAFLPERKMSAAAVLTAVSAVVIVVSIFLRLERKEAATAAGPIRVGAFVRRFLPFVLFVLCVYPAGGLAYRILQPVATEWPLGGGGFWAYSLALACGAVVRRTNLAAVASMVGVGLSMLTLELTGVAGVPVLAAGYFGVMAGLGLADLFVWRTVLALFAAGRRREASGCLAVNAATVAAGGAVLDLLGFHPAERIPFSSFLVGSVLLMLAPIAGMLLAEKRMGDSAAASDVSELLLTLTPAEQKVMDLLLAGRTYAEIAADLCVSPNTVKFHVRNLYRKTGCRSRSELQRIVRKQHRPGE